MILWMALYCADSIQQLLSLMEKTMDRPLRVIAAIQQQDWRTLKVDALANEIRRLDGDNRLGAGALAEALMPFLLANFAQSAQQTMSLKQSSESIQHHTLA